MTELLRRLQAGDRNVLDEVMPLLYGELKKLARSHLRRESNPGTLETTALVHEAYLKLAVSKHPTYENRGHFYGITSRLMRQVLVDSARARRAEKRGPSHEVAVRDLRDHEPEPSRPLLALDDVLEALEKAYPVKARLIEMRYFGGMTAIECGEALSMPDHVVRRELRLAKAWLRKEMATESRDDR